MITLTDEQRKVLTHIVLDADAWLEGAIVGLGIVLDENGNKIVDREIGEIKAQEALVLKVNRWKPQYLAQKDHEKYLNREERDTFELYKNKINELKKEGRFTEELFKEGISELKIKYINMSEKKIRLLMEEDLLPTPFPPIKE